MNIGVLHDKDTIRACEGMVGPSSSPVDSAQSRLPQEDPRMAVLPRVTRVPISRIGKIVRTPTSSALRMNPFLEGTALL
jgi:hypothetical protein